MKLAYRESITQQSWVYTPEIRLIRYNIDMQVDKWRIPPERNNPFFYCYWNKTPGAEIHAGGKVYPVSPEYIMLIPPNFEHSPVQTGPFNHSFIHFIALPPFDSLNTIELFPAAQFEALFRKRENEFKTSLALHSLIFELLLQIPEERFNCRQISDERIFWARHLISLCSSRKLQLNEIAEKLNMSVSSLSHLFKEESGISPIRYAMEGRLEKALLLLADAHITIEEVARKTGFSDRYHFSKAFKARYGATPVQMRKTLTGHRE